MAYLSALDVNHNKALYRSTTFTLLILLTATQGERVSGALVPTLRNHLLIVLLVG